VQALADVHAKFIEEASSAYVTAVGEARAQVPAAVADATVVKQIRDPNERILARARDAGSKALDGYETALRRMSEFETTVAGASQLDWVKALAASPRRVPHRRRRAVRQRSAYPAGRPLRARSDPTGVSAMGARSRSLCGATVRSTRSEPSRVAPIRHNTQEVAHR
jgi:hypothetical protein